MILWSPVIGFNQKVLRYYGVAFFASQHLVNFQNSLPFSSLFSVSPRYGLILYKVLEDAWYSFRKLAQVPRSAVVIFLLLSVIRFKK